jgi:hypothetical protein
MDTKYDSVFVVLAIFTFFIGASVLSVYFLPWDVSDINSTEAASHGPGQRSTDYSRYNSFADFVSGTDSRQNAASTTLDSEINAFVSQHASRNGAVENPDARQVFFGDLNNDGRDDAVVFYTIEGPGTNDYARYMAVFVGSDDTYAFADQKQVSGTSGRAIAFDSIHDGTIELQTLEYAPSDGYWSKSHEGRTAFKLVGKRLVEQKPR